MEVLCYGLSLPISEHDAIKDCVNVYCEWLSSLLTNPKICVPQPVIDDPNLYARKIISHFHYLFVPRKDEGRLARMGIKLERCRFFVSLAARFDFALFSLIFFV